MKTSKSTFYVFLPFPTPLNHQDTDYIRIFTPIFLFKKGGGVFNNENSNTLGPKKIKLSHKILHASNFTKY